MPYSEAQNRATEKWVKANYDKITFTAPKGFKERIKKAAKGRPMRAFILDAIEEKMNKEN